MKRFFLLFSALAASLASTVQAQSVTVVPPQAGVIAGNPNQVFVIVGDRFNAELRRTSTYLQWRGDSTKVWQNLVPLTALTPTSMPWDSLLSKPSVITNLQSLLDAKQAALGFTPENSSNKATNLASPNGTKYPTTQAVADGLALKYDSTQTYPKSVLGPWLAGKVDKVTGKQLSTNDYTTAEQNKLAGVQVNATANSTDAQLRDRSTHTGTQGPGTIVQDASNRFVTDAEKATWNGKQNALGFTAENNANKATNLTSPDNTKYPTTQAVSTALGGKQDALGFTAENSANKGTASGYAPLDASSKVPVANLPTGTGASNVAAGNDSRILGAEQSANKATNLTSPDNTKYPTTQAVANGLALKYDSTQTYPKSVLGPWLAGKVDKVTGKQLSTNDYTTAEQNKLAGVQVNATANSTDAQLRDRSTHTGTQGPGTIVQDASNRFVTDAEKATWNGKQNALGFTAENNANKATNLTSPDNTKYPTTQAVSTALGGKQDALGFTAENSANKGTASGYAPLDASSKVPVANLPTGTGASNVAAGNDSRILGAEQSANKGTANGYAPLDGTGKVPSANLPAGGGTNYQTAQNAGSNVTQRATVNYTNGVKATDNSGSSRTDVEINVGNGLQITGGKLATGGDLKDAKSYNSAGNYTTDDTTPLQALFSGLTNGQAALLPGRSKVSGMLTLPSGQSLFGLGSRPQYAGFVVDSTYLGTVLWARNQSTVFNTSVYNIKNAAPTTDTLQVGLLTTESDHSVRVINFSAINFGVGGKFSAYRLRITNFQAALCNIGLWLRGRPYTGFSYTGAVVVNDPEVRNSQVGIYMDGYVSSTTINNPTLETNQTGIWGKNAVVVVTRPYIGDNHRYGVRVDGGKIEVVGDLTRPIQGAAGYAVGSETPRNSAYDGAGVYVTNGGKAILRDVNLYRPTWYGDGYGTVVGYEGLGAGQNRGSAIYLATGTEVEMQGHVTTTGIFPYRGGGKITGRKLTNYVANGSFSDTARLAHTVSATVTGTGSNSAFSSTPTNLGGYVAAFSSEIQIFYEVPQQLVGRQMYVHCWIANNSVAIAKPTATAINGKNSSGWTLVSNNSNGNWVGVATEQSDRVNSSGPSFSDQWVFNRIPVTITAAKGSFVVYSDNTNFRLAGFWLTDDENYQELGLYAEPIGRPLATATPTRGTWKLGDEVALFDRTALGYSHLICTVAGTPGTWRALAANDASLLTKGLLPPARLPASASYDPWQQYRYFNDFTNNGSSSELGTAVNGTGAAINTVAVSSASFGNNAVGVIELNTGTTTTGYASFAHSTSSIVNTSDSSWVDGLLALPTLPSTTQNYTLVFGFGSTQSTAAQANGAYFNLTYNSGVELTAKTTLSSSSTSTTLTAPSASTAYKWRVVMVTGTVKFYVGGVLVATHTTNTPGTGQPIRAMATCVKSAGITAVAPQFDAIQVGKNFSSTRF